MNKIFTFGDGFATGHLWPEWPQILQALLPEYAIVNSAGIGAGPEWLVHKFVNLLPDIANNIVVFQWPQADRFDKLIENADWNDIVNSDPVYHFNLHSDDDNTWWLSSASETPIVQQYHTIVQQKQHKIRRKNYEILVKNTLENNNCNYYFTSTLDQQLFSNQKRFYTTRQNNIQPSPIVHFYFVTEVILPNLKIQVCENRILNLMQLITTQDWHAYDPDRDEIWNNITSKLD